MKVVYSCISFLYSEIFGAPRTFLKRFQSDSGYIVMQKLRRLSISDCVLKPEAVKVAF